MQDYTELHTTKSERDPGSHSVVDPFAHRPAHVNFLQTNGEYPDDAVYDRHQLHMDEGFVIDQIDQLLQQQPSRPGRKRKSPEYNGGNVADLQGNGASPTFDDGTLLRIPADGKSIGSS